MITRFQRYINDHHLFQKTDRLILAVSGGIDSVVLVDLCVRSGYDFVIAHMNFNLRAAESKRDEHFVRKLGAGNQVAVYVNEVDTTAYSSVNNLSIQEAARKLRYTWFEELRATLQQQAEGKMVYVVTAHHKDDSVETMMMNLFRGTGLTGLRGILPVHGAVIRPLLVFSKDDIVSYAGERELDWVEDSSNQLDKYTRNYFRNQILPMVKAIYPEAGQNLYNNLQRFNDAHILYRENIDNRLKKLLEQRGEEVHIAIRKLKKMTAWQTVLFEILQNYHFSAGQLSHAVNLLDAETGRSLVGEQYRLIKNRDWLIIAPVQQLNSNYLVIGEEEVRVDFEKGRLELDRIDRNSVQFRDDKRGIPVNAAPELAYLDADKLDFPLLLRRFRTGDYFYPLGMKKKKKIARFMIDQKLSKTRKENIWVLESAKKIVWVVGLRIDNRFRMNDHTKTVLLIRTSI